jgi:hypothetical protein
MRTFMVGVVRLPDLAGSLPGPGRGRPTGRSPGTVGYHAGTHVRSRGRPRDERASSEPACHVVSSRERARISPRFGRHLSRPRRRPDQNDSERFWAHADQSATDPAVHASLTQGRHVGPDQAVAPGQHGSAIPTWLLFGGQVRRRVARDRPLSADGEGSGRLSSFMSSRFMARAASRVSVSSRVSACKRESCWRSRWLSASSSAERCSSWSSSGPVARPRARSASAPSWRANRSRRTAFFGEAPCLFLRVGQVGAQRLFGDERAGGEPPGPFPTGLALPVAGGRDPGGELGVGVEQ